MRKICNKCGHVWGAYEDTCHCTGPCHNRDICEQKPGVSEMLEANNLVNGERQSDYGTPRENYTGIAKVWSGILAPILKRDITPEEAALLMVGLKLQRQAMKHKRDNLVDAHGYLLVYAHIRQDRENNSKV